MRVSSAGKWLAAMTTSELAGMDDERRALAQLRWDSAHGDRHTAMTVLVYSAHAGEILNALDGALVSDDELRFSTQWVDYADPFGDWPEDLGEAPEGTPEDIAAARRRAR